MRPPTQSSTPPFSQVQPTQPPSRLETEPLLSLLFQSEGHLPRTQLPLRPNRLAPPSPLTLSPIPAQSEKSASPPPLLTPLRPQSGHKSRANSIHSSLLTDPDTDRERDGSKDLSILWRRVQ